jgi:hypothetical protein
MVTESLAEPMALVAEHVYFLSFVFGTDAEAQPLVVGAGFPVTVQLNATVEVLYSNDLSQDATMRNPLT